MTETAERRTRTVTKPPALDYGKIRPKSAPEIPANGGRPSLLDGTPIREWTKESFESGKARQIVVPAETTDALVRMFAAASRELNVSVRTMVTDNGDGSAVLVYQAVPKRKRAANKSKGV